MIEEKWELDLDPRQAAALLDEKLDAECVKAYELTCDSKQDTQEDAQTEERQSSDRQPSDQQPDGCELCCVVRIYEKWFGLTGARAAMTVTFDNLSGKNRVKFTAAGGTRMPKGRLDWGVRGSFEKMAKDILYSHRVTS